MTGTSKNQASGQPTPGLDARRRRVKKLESLAADVGRIAHDLSNVLQGVQANADVALLKLDPDSPARANLEEILSAVSRASGVVDQLTAYIGDEAESKSGEDFAGPASASLEAPIAAADRGNVAEGRRAGTILLVDSEEAVRTTAGRMLEFLGYKLLTANDGRQAIEVFRGHAQEIDLVLFDLETSNLGGLEAFDEIQRIRADARVILSAGAGTEAAIEVSASKKLAGFIRKPYRLAVLREKLRQALGD